MTLRSWLLLLCSLPAAPWICAQPHIPELPGSQVEKRFRLLANQPMPELRFLTPQESRLANRAVLLRATMPSLPLVAVAVAFKDVRTAPMPVREALAAEIGLLILRENLQRLQQELAPFGAEISLDADRVLRHVIIRSSGLSDTFERWAPALVSGICDENLTPESFSRALARVEDPSRWTPESLFADALAHSLYGVPLVSTSSGWPDMDEVAQWYHSRFSATRMTLATSGENAQPLIAAADRCAGRPGVPSDVPRAEAPSAAGGPVWVVDQPKSSQTRFVLAARTVAQSSPKWPSVLLANHMLGASPTSRLYTRIRVARGLSYDVTSYLALYAQDNPLIIRGSVQPEKTKEFVEALQRELAELAQSPVPEAELAAVKFSFLAGLSLSSEGTAQRLNLLLAPSLAGAGTRYWADLPAKIWRVSADDLRQVTRTYLRPESFAVVTLGNARALEAALAPLDRAVRVVSVPAK